ncbi:MAG: helix-turn-helix domain-containing protein [Sandaracinaceae bacterium]
MTDEGLRLCVPTGPARRWLRLVWEWPGYTGSGACDRILPHGLCEVSWELNRGHRLLRDGQLERFDGPTFIGPSTTPYWVDTPVPMHLFGMLFVPGAARFVLGSSVEDARGCFCSFSDIPLGNRLVTEVGDARSWEGRAAVVLDSFANLPAPQIGRATSALLRAWTDAPTRSVKSVRAALGMSAPTFVKQVRHDLGLRPAEVRQLARFRQALARVAEGGPLARVALESGYADQAHMSRSFRRFSGLTPRAVRPRSAAHPFHLPEAGFPFVQDAP